MDVRAARAGAVVVVLVLLVYLGARLVRARRFVRAVRARFGLDARPAVPARALRALGGGALLGPRTYAQYRAEVDDLVRRALALGDFSDGVGANLQDACALALQGGKRIRPIIVLEIARKVGAGRPELAPIDAADAALAVECLHAASLVVDDLPAFDGDSVRRGRPAVWAAAGQGKALMAATALTACAFLNMCRQVDWVRENCPPDLRAHVNVDRVGTALCGLVARALGAAGAPGGQALDGAVLAGAVPGGAGQACAVPAGAEQVRALVQRKTAPFFEVSFVAGWLVGGGALDDEAVDDLGRAGRNFGVAFQVADDLGDLAKDRQRGAPNFAAAFGEEEAELELTRRLGACRLTLARYGLLSPLWEEIFAQVVEMSV